MSLHVYYRHSQYNVCYRFIDSRRQLKAHIAAIENEIEIPAREERQREYEKKKETNLTKADEKKAEHIRMERQEKNTFE